MNKIEEIAERVVSDIGEEPPTPPVDRRILLNNWAMTVGTGVITEYFIINPDQSRNVEAITRTNSSSAEFKPEKNYEVEAHLSVNSSITSGSSSTNLKVSRYSNLYGGSSSQADLEDLSGVEQTEWVVNTY